MLRRIRNQSQRGSLLIRTLQVLIGTAIFGILAAIIIPNLPNERRSMSEEAKSTLKDLRMREENFRMEHGRYTASLPDLDFSQPAGARYTYSIAEANDIGCTMVADGNTGEPVSGEEWHMVITAGVAGLPELQ